MSNSDDVNSIVMLHVFVHSHYETGEPLSIDVFEISGRVHMTWYSDALEAESAQRQKDLATEFYSHMDKIDDSAWFLCRMCTEDASGTPEHYVEILHRIEQEGGR